MERSLSEYRESSDGEHNKIFMDREIKLWERYKLLEERKQSFFWLLQHCSIGAEIQDIIYTLTQHWPETFCTLLSIACLSCCLVCSDFSLDLLAILFRTRPNAYYANADFMLIFIRILLVFWLKFLTLLDTINHTVLSL